MGYITVEDVRAEGIPAPLYSDPIIEERIELASETIKILTGRVFEKLTDYEMKLDGTGYDTIRLPIPPCDTGITEVTMDGDVIDPEKYELLMPEPRGRFYPKLRLSGTYIWTKEKSNIVITGTFGFVDSFGGNPEVFAAPRSIQHVCKLIVINGIKPLGDSDASKEGRIIEEELGDYSYKLSEVQTRGYFGDDRIDNIIAMYRKQEGYAV